MLSNRFSRLNALGELIRNRTPSRNQAVEDARKMRSDFLDVASHEFKTPLTALKLDLQLMARLTEAGLAHEELVRRCALLSRRADCQVNRMTLFINDLLDASAIRSGELILRRSPCELGSLVQREVERFQKASSCTQVSVKIATSRSVVGEWDSDRIAQTLRLLLTNAVIYGKQKPIQVRVGASKRWAKISVRDHGIGISEKDRERIFAMCERGVPVENFGGIGLGLFIAHQVARSHGGDLAVRSRLGKGAVFVLTLPTRIDYLDFVSRDGFNKKDEQKPTDLEQLRDRPVLDPSGCPSQGFNRTRLSWTGSMRRRMSRGGRTHGSGCGS